MRDWAVEIVHLKYMSGKMVLLAVPVLLCACSGKPPQRYTVHGEIMGLDPQANIAKIKHQKIEGWLGGMPAMTMEFPVKDAQEFKALHPGDCVTATLFAKGEDTWIGEIRHETAAPGECLGTSP
jgi:Cu/Ag efflux protein CusF